MKLWINPANYCQAKSLIKNKHIDYVVVGLKNKLSCRNNCLLDIDEIKEINCDKLAISLNNLYVDDQIEYLTKILKQLKKINVKTLIFTDFAIKQICDEIDYKPEFVYNSETLTTNYGQLPLYKNNGINEVMLPRELFLNEVKEFCKNKNGVKLQIQAEGYGLLMHSKWMLLTNFAKQFNINKDLTNQMFYLKEETRNLPNLIIEDETGSHIFTGHNVSLLEYLDEFKDIDSLFIFSFLHDEKWVDETVKIYIEAISALENNTFKDTKNKLVERIKQINKVSSCGFIDPTKGLLHLQREVDNE